MFLEQFINKVIVHDTIFLLEGITINYFRHNNKLNTYINYIEFTVNDNSVLNIIDRLKVVRNLFIHDRLYY